MSSPTAIPVRRAAQSRLGTFDLGAIPFGGVMADHMLTMAWHDGAWQAPEIVPYGPIALEPGVMTFHYAQMAFEGLKAYRSADGGLRLFRPGRNAARLQASCRRLCMPEMPESLFVDAVRALVAADAAWVPRGPGEALYIRPLLFSAEAHLDVRPSRRYRFVVVTCPVGAYFKSGFSGLSLLVETEHVRAAASGGLGAAKTGANYAGSLHAGERARAAGFDQVIWLDATERRFVEEAGLMNLFVRIGGEIATPPLGDSILPGVTRDSVLHLLRTEGGGAAERPIAIDEIVAAHEAGRLEEAFATGTAAVVTPIRRIGFAGRILDIAPRNDSVAATLYERLTGIQYGRAPDLYGWTVPVA